MPVNLDNVLRALHNALIEAQKLTQEQHMRSLKRYFNESEDGESLGEPKMLKLKLPFAKNDAITYEEVDVPLIALTPPSSIKIKNTKIDFDAKITGFEGEKKKGFHFSDLFSKKKDLEVDVSSHEGPLNLNLDNNETGTTVRIQIEFTADEIPETVARINDHIIKSFPF